VAAIWVVSEQGSLAAALARHLETLGEVWVGEPERGAFKHAPAPDLLTLIGVGEQGLRRDALEQLLAFVHSVPQSRRAPAPVLWVELDPYSSGGFALERAFDDRPFTRLAFPLDPEELTARARSLVAARGAPASLRERARQDWVRAEVERLYAGLDLPALRQAVDPRNAHRPVLLLGEPGSRRGLLARYVHDFAEPARDELVLVSLADALPGELERSVFARTSGRRTSVYLPRLDRAPRALHEELTQLLGSSGALGLEPIRWIVSATHFAALGGALRELPWLRVELPPLRARSDLRELIGSALRASCERLGRSVSLDREAQAALLAYPWPGNLAELDRVLDESVAATSGAEIRAAELAIGPRHVRPAQAVTPPEPEPAAPAEAARVEPEPAEPAHTEPTPVEPEAVPPEPLLPLSELTPAARLESDEDLTAASFEPLSDGDPFEEIELVDEVEDSPFADPDEDSLPEAELEPEPPLERAPSPPAHAAARSGPSLRELLVPLANEIRRPLRAVRTYAGLVEQRPYDAEVRRELRSLVETDLGSVDETLQRVERFIRFGPPQPRPFELAAALAAELDLRQSVARAKQLVVLRELDAQAPPLVADETQIRFAVSSLLDRALALVPIGGDVYLGSAWHAKRDERPAGHRIMLRFHSPEDVLAAPLDDPEAAFVEVVMARDLFERAGGTFAIDASGPQDNVILVELPG
jgi:hypothetical protein